MSDAILASLHRVAAEWASVMLRASWQGGLALLLVWLISRAPLAPSAAVRCWLWRLAYLELLIAPLWLPVVELPLWPAAPPAMGASQDGLETTAARSIAELRSPEQELASSPRDARPPLAPTRATWPMLIWFPGLAGSTVRLLRDRRSARRLVASAVPMDDPLAREALLQLCRVVRLSYPPGLLLSDGGGSPLLTGLRRPVIVVPAGLLARCTAGELALLLAHELAHLRRRDLFWNCLPALAQAIFWFHPLVWLGGPEWRLAQETACDELAVRTTGASAGSYAGLLVRVSRRLGSNGARSWQTLGVLDSYLMLRRRVMAMKSTRSGARRWRAIVSPLVVALVAAGLIPWRVTARAAQAGGDHEQDVNSQIRLAMLGTALRMYQEDYSGMMPPMKDSSATKKALLPYVRKIEAVFTDPHADRPYLMNPSLSGAKVGMFARLINVDGLSAKRPTQYRSQARTLGPLMMRVEPGGRGRVEFQYRMLRRGAISYIGPGAIVAFYEPETAADGTRGVLYADGHVARISEAEWVAVKRASSIP